MGSFSLSGGVEVFGFISPSNTTDQYPVIDPLYGIDGLRNVNTLSDLNLIPTLRRRAGMLVGVSGGTVYYKLNLPPWNGTLSDWSIFNSGGGISGDYLPLSGGTVTGATIFTNGVTANTFSASTYFNLPIDVFVTGGTYDNVTGTATFTNNTGGTFNVSGISSFDTFVTGFSYSNNTFTISQNSGTSLTATINSVTGLTASTISAATFNGDIVALNGTSVTNPTYRTSLAGSNLSPRATFGSETTAANSHRYIFDPVNQNGLVFSIANNGSVYIARGGIVAGGSGSIAQEIGDLRFYTLNSPNATLFSERMRLDHFGNLGIGTTSPSEKLDVVGKTKTTSIQITSGATNGYVLTSDVSGNGTWQQIPSFTGGTVTGSTNFTNGLTANTISATTYQNLPTDIRVTGGTFSSETITFTNNTGGTFSVTGFSDGDISSYVTKNSLTGVTNWQSLTLFNNGASTVAIANDVIRVYPIILWEDITIDEIQIRITAGNGVGSLLIGIWKWENGLGTNLVYTSPVFNTNVTGYQSFTSQNQFLPRGTYIIGYNTNLNGASIVSQTGFANIFGEQASGGGAFQLQVNHTYTGTLPTPFPTTAVAISFAPIRVQFKLI